MLLQLQRLLASKKAVSKLPARAMQIPKSQRASLQENQFLLKHEEKKIKHFASHERGSPRSPKLASRRHLKYSVKGRYIEKLLGPYINEVLFTPKSVYHGPENEKVFVKIWGFDKHPDFPPKNPSEKLRGGVSKFASSNFKYTQPSQEVQYEGRNFLDPDTVAEEERARINEMQIDDVPPATELRPRKDKASILPCAARRRKELLDYQTKRALIWVRDGKVKSAKQEMKPKGCGNTALQQKNDRRLKIRWSKLVSSASVDYPAKVFATQSQTSPLETEPVVQELPARAKPVTHLKRKPKPIKYHEAQVGPIAGPVAEPEPEPEKSQDTKSKPRKGLKLKPLRRRMLFQTKSHARETARSHKTLVALPQKPIDFRKLSKGVSSISRQCRRAMTSKWAEQECQESILLRWRKRQQEILAAWHTPPQSPPGQALSAPPVAAPMTALQTLEEQILSSHLDTAQGQTAASPHLIAPITPPLTPHSQTSSNHSNNAPIIPLPTASGAPPAPFPQQSLPPAAAVNQPSQQSGSSPPQNLLPMSNGPDADSTNAAQHPFQQNSSTLPTSSNIEPSAGNAPPPPPPPLRDSAALQKPAQTPKAAPKAGTVSHEWAPFKNATERLELPQQVPFSQAFTASTNTSTFSQQWQVFAALLSQVPNKYKKLAKETFETTHNPKDNTPSPVESSVKVLWIEQLLEHGPGAELDYKSWDDAPIPSDVQVKQLMVDEYHRFQSDCPEAWVAAFTRAIRGGVAKESPTCMMENNHLTGETWSIDWMWIDQIARRRDRGEKLSEHARRFVENKQRVPVQHQERFEVFMTKIEEEPMLLFWEVAGEWMDKQPPKMLKRILKNAGFCPESEHKQEEEFVKWLFEEAPLVVQGPCLRVWRSRCPRFVWTIEKELREARED